MAESGRPSPNVPFRTACDPCSTAKVRCDKKHPTCDRCIQIKQPCSYSESRKHGRQLWRKKLALERATAASKTTTDAQPLVKQVYPAPPITSPGKPGRNPSLVSSSVPLMSDQTWESLFDHEQHEPGDPTALLPVWSSGDGFTNETDIDPFSTWDVANSLPSAFLSGDDLHVHMATHGDAVPRTIVFEEEPPLTPTTSNLHDCEARAITILGSLQHGEMHQGLTSCSVDPTNVYADLNLTPNFDRVLAINKAALGGWSKLMRCSCAQCPHLILLYVSILSKMLFWYRVAVMDKHATASGDSSPSRGSDTTGPSPEEAPSIDRFGVRPTVIQVGTLSLDNEDQAELRRILLLRELHRTRKAIDEFINVDRAAMEEKVRCTVQWSLTGISRVREELQDLIEQVKQIRLREW
ncbi:hypothetical protein LTR10_014708 [Elasticomyces elasticus]|uniref:Zn(2)-C6 fungal-type domain-containing protein n=1 Tax=Exophiala sideris TaxID=1016849 RepID=A0ABR0J750_9EURO|nr:hypothetical protein LTR10_014708 [Elasticomyces elasticus]KAK5029353.1 hypothetical protein LTS07_005815 [Exophiala sideris]KAK5036951.1 hypothetical protein LTR13_005331 [Exophiala sideris]KAK5057983.1 hypothetical protein LTR69_006980 [Exophiala sideris]KAK5181942.1 hypothetical protein LTR44_005543 [Eurotiomycetes sp. CCFEE 6388]